MWHEQVKALLRGYIAHLREIGLYDRVIAYQIAAGACGEWVKGDSDQGKRFGDFSAPMRRCFGGWLRRKYGNDVAALRAAWNDSTVSFDFAEAPSPKAPTDNAARRFPRPAARDASD
ncbi:MAG: hypothetical protein HC853_07340 [Anaerolineae bacterium]|nr:hypothetical protein [Anaerolineae bacterium]